MGPSSKHSKKSGISRRTLDKRSMTCGAETYHKWLLLCKLELCSNSDENIKQKSTLCIKPKKKALPRAVDRNFFKRIVRELFNAYRKTTNKPFAVTISTEKRPADACKENIKRDIEDIFKKAGLS